MKFQIILNISLILLFSTASRGQHSQLRTQHTESITINPLKSSTLYCASTWRLFRSNDTGNTWSLVYEFPKEIGIRQILLSKGDTNRVILNCIGSGSVAGIYKSEDNGTQFKKVLDASSNGQSMYLFDDMLSFASRVPAHIYISTNFGTTWNITDDTPSPQTISKICTYYQSSFNAASVRLIGTEPATIYRRCDTGWVKTSYSKGGNIDEVPQILSINGKDIYAILSRSGSNFTDGVMRSNDSGKSWKTLRSPASLWAIDIDKNNPKRIFIGQFGWIDRDYSASSIYMSNNSGDSWLPIGSIHDDMIWDIEYDTPTHTLYAAGGGGLYRFSIQK